MAELEPLPTVRPAVLGRKYIVASGHYLASMAGARILEMGGNVVDAGVAAGLCINVLQPDLTNLGGVAPIILRTAQSRDVVTISGLGWWPKAATIDELRRRGADLTGGPLAAVMPAAADAWIVALDRYGTMPLAEVAAPAIELADEGFPVNRFLEANLRDAAGKLAGWPTSRAVFLSRGRAPRMGELLVQKELVHTLRLMVDAERAADGRHTGLRAARDLFYKGEIAQVTAAFNQEIGGLLTREDLAGFEVQVEPPVRTSYRGVDVYACGPWCQGPVVPATLNILEGYDLAALPHNSAAALHLVAEALKAAFADRHAYYGDPRFVEVPIEGLLSRGYAAAWRERIDRAKAWPEMPDPGDPWQYQRASGKRPVGERVAPAPGPEPADTSYLCVLDRDGNAFSATPSDGIGSTPLVPGFGFVVSARGTQSWLDPSHPSGLAPGKRPRLTPSPGVVLKDGRVLMPYGTPGLDVQPQAMVQFLINLLDHGLEVQEAIEAPRIATYSFPASSHPHAYHPGLLRVEDRIPLQVRAQLAQMGHGIEVWPAWMPRAGAMCAAVLNHAERTLAGGADPRRIAYAVGW
jgi:gamma-glutamyltranspeptidase / glutathione hydrolase